MLSTAVFASTLLAAALVPSAYATSLRQLMPTPHFCSIEQGYDYLGNDVANKQGPAESCCDICYKTTGCQAWTWTDFNGGTCWLKSSRGQPVVNANAKSSIMTVSPPSMCSIRKNIDYVGNDLTRVNGAKPEDCCDACHNTPGCRAYSWSDDQGGSCWLKSKVTQVVFKAGVHSAGAYPSEHPQCDNVQRGVDYLGNDIGNTRSSTPEGCCDFCETTPNCRVYSWTDYEGGTCWLKSRSGNVSYTDGVFSAQVMDDPDDHCMYRYDTDYEGSDIANVPGKDTYECCAICKGHAGCAYFGWTDFNGGTCWLKSSAGHVVAKNGVQSGFVRL